MSARLITVLAVLAGLLLIVAGVTIPLWMAVAGIGDVQAAQILWDNQVANYLYTITVFLSCVLMAPVILVLSFRLYPSRRDFAVLGGVLFLFGLVLEAVGTMSSLARWPVAIPQALTGDATGLALYRTLTRLYLAVDFSGVALIYVAAIIYTIGLWRLHRLSAYLLVVSTALLVIAFGVPALYSTLVLAGSIVVYGVAYGALGQAAIQLGMPGGAEPTRPTPPSTARNRRASRRKRRR